MAPDRISAVQDGLTLIPHIRVVELADGIACRYAGRLLCDLGANVTRVRPRAADAGPRDVLSDYLDSGKQLDTTTTLGSRLHELCLNADVILIDEESNSVNPALVLAAGHQATPLVVAVASPYGMDSPYQGTCGDELFFAALSGIASITPEDFEDRTSERPMQLYGHQASLLAGLTLAVACLQAWRSAKAHRDLRVLDFSTLDALMSVPLISQAAGFTGQPLPAPPSLRPQTVPRGFLECADGYIYTQGGDDNWPAWCAVVGKADWKSGSWAEPPFRAVHWPEIDNEISAWLRGHRAEDVYRQCQAEGITAFPVNSPGQTLANPQMVHRDLVISKVGPTGRRFQTLRSPFRTAGAAATVDAPPREGHHD